jgi:error-prone DNA polymerase
VLAPDINLSGAECALERDADGMLAVRIGLGYVKGVREAEIRELVAARETSGGFANLSELAARSGAAAPSLELLAWSGACDSLVGEGTGSVRRIALWQLGVATPGKRVRGGTQLALPLDLPTPPALRALSDWDAMLADYSATGLTTGAHPIALLRKRIPATAVTSRDLETLRHGSRVEVGGLVVARQRPGTAKGVVFILLEDEHGTINLIVPPDLYDRERLTVRTEPLVLAHGRLERLPAAGGAISVLVDRIGSIAAPDRVVAQVKDFSPLDDRERERIERERAERVAAGHGGAEERWAQGPDGAEDFRAVAPPVMSFASGRRR